MEKKTKKLQLNKETIAVLNSGSMAHIVGGALYMKCDLDQNCMHGEVCVVYTDLGYGVCMQAGADPGFLSRGKTTCQTTKAHSCDSICISK